MGFGKNRPAPKAGQARANNAPSPPGDTAGADINVAEQQRSKDGRHGRRCSKGLQRRTCNAPGLTMLVGVPLMKLTTLSKAALKYIS